MATKKTATKDTKTKRLVILDTHAIIHRAYHAIPELTSSDGQPTGALFGLVTMLLRAIVDLKPDYIVAARDRAEKTYRHELFEEYKGTRAKTDDALIAQIVRTGEVFDAFGVPALDVAGFEADDVIGTIAEQVKNKKDLETVILTGDMDMLQLIVDGRVTVYRLLTGITNMKFYDEEAVKERYGFGPEHVTDYKGMCGDQSDNIKGIKGIGEKTATELIQKFGSIEDMYKILKKNPGEFSKKGIKPRVIELLKNGEEDALFSKSLATIRRDAPIKFTQPGSSWRLEDHKDAIIQLCDALEFRSIKERVRTLVGAAPEEKEDSETEPAAIDPHMLKETSVALWLLHSDTSNPSLEDILTYARTEDLEKAREKILKELKETGHLNDVFEKIEKPLIPVVEQMNDTGVFIDVAHMRALEKEYSKKLADIAGRIYKTVGHEFNINSPKQLGVVLFDELKMAAGAKQKKTATGARTTKESELMKLAKDNPIVAEVLDYRELQKLLGTYIEKMPALVDKKSRLHAEFVQAGTTTGRMSSQNPNLQNIPIQTDNGRRIRNAFAAPKGRCVVALDYSQIELRLAAGLSGDKKLIEVFKSGGDVHTAVASEVFNVSPEKVDKEMRRRAKVINFGILYGMGANALRQNLGGDVTRDEAANYLTEYFKKYAGLARFVEETKLSAARLGYTETLFGRRRYFSGFDSTLPGMRAAAERMAVNAPLQGTQSDIIKMAMTQADALIEQKGWREKVALVMQVHDELVYEVDAKEAPAIAHVIRHVMETAVSKEMLSGVPIVVEAAVGPNWGSTTKLPR